MRNDIIYLGGVSFPVCGSRVNLEARAVAQKNREKGNKPQYIELRTVEPVGITRPSCTHVPGRVRRRGFQTLCNNLIGAGCFYGLTPAIDPASNDSFNRLL